MLLLTSLALPSQTSTNGSVTSFLSYNLAIQESISGRFLAENIHSKNWPWRNTTSASSEFSKLFILPIFEMLATIFFDLETKQKHILRQDIFASKWARLCSDNDLGKSAVFSPKNWVTKIIWALGKHYGEVQKNWYKNTQVRVISFEQLSVAEFSGK